MTELAATFKLLPLQRSPFWVFSANDCIFRVAVVKDNWLQCSIKEDPQSPTGYASYWGFLKGPSSVRHSEVVPRAAIAAELEDSVGGQALAALMLSRLVEASLEALARIIHGALAEAKTYAGDLTEKLALVEAQVEQALVAFEEKLGSW